MCTNNALKQYMACKHTLRRDASRSKRFCARNATTHQRGCLLPDFPYLQDPQIPPDRCESSEKAKKCFSGIRKIQLKFLDPIR
jgi:hypothetical protein